MSRPIVGAIVAAGGRGMRAGSDHPKQFLPLGGKPLLLHVLDYFETSTLIDAVVVVSAADLMEETRRLVASKQYAKLKCLTEGGTERQDSVWNGLSYYQSHPADFILVHDAARPFIDDGLVGSILEAAVECGAAVPGLPLKETVKEGTAEGYVVSTLDRTKLWLIQTPQVFRYKVLYDAFLQAKNSGFYGTDDAGVVENAGGKVKIVPGRYDNIKITTAEDFGLAEYLGRLRSQGARSS